MNRHLQGVALEAGHVVDQRAIRLLERGDIGLELGDIRLQFGNVPFDTVQPRRHPEELVGKQRPLQVPAGQRVAATRRRLSKPCGGHYASAGE